MSEADAPGADTWVAWGHVAIPIGKLSKVPSTATLNFASLNDRGKAIVEAIKTWAPGLLPPGQQRASISRDALKQVLREVAVLVEPEREFEYQRRLLEVIDHGNRCGQFRIPIPYIPAPLPPPKRSPFVPESFEALSDFNDLLLSFARSLERDLVLARKAWWGRTFLSALLYGGLLRPEWLLAIPKALTEKPDRSLRWLDLRLPIRVAPFARAKPAADQAAAQRPPATDTIDPIFALRRWFIDPVTRLLLANAPRDIAIATSFPGSTDSDKVMRLVAEYVRVAAVSGKLPRRFRDLALITKTRLHLHLPSYLVEYLAGNFANTSLPAHSWERILHPPDRVAFALSDLPPRQDTRQVLPTESDTGPAPDVSADRSIPLDEETWVEQFRELVSIVQRGQQDVRAELQAWRTQSTGQLIASVDTLAQWVDEWLLRRRGTRSPLGRRTIYQYLRTAGKELVGQLADVDPRKLLDEDAYIELYESALDGIEPVGERRRAASALRHFHDFLVATFEAPAIENSTLIVIGGKNPSPVDANLIAADTFFRAMQLLRSNITARYPKDKALPEAVCRIAALGFFGGLRRSEAIGLTLRDLRGTEELTLTVAPNKLRGLKTRNAYRNIPLSQLMPPVELNQLLAWREQRERAGAGSGALLFPGFEASGGKGVRNNHQHLTRITEALQLATHDRSFRFHHLRHSFASWMLLKFWIAEQPEGGAVIPAWFLPTKHDTTRFAVAKRERQALLGTAETNRRGLLQISRLLGHANVAITLGSYVHLVDFIAGLAVARVAPRRGARSLPMLSGSSHQRASQVLEAKKPATEEQIDTILDNADQATPTSAQHIVVDKTLKRGRQVQVSSTLGKVNVLQPPLVHAPRAGFARLLHIARALCSIDPQGTNLASVAAVANLQERQVRTWWTRFQLLGNGIVTDPYSTESQRVGWVGLPDHGRLSKRAEQLLNRIENLKRNGTLSSSRTGTQAQGKQTRRVSGGTATKLINRLMADIAKCMRSESSVFILCGRVADAQRWLWLVRAVEVADSMDAAHLARSSKAESSEKAQRNHWSVALGIRVRPSSVQLTTTVGSRGAIVLTPMFKPYLRPSEQAQSEQDFVLLRFLLIMLRITRR